MPEKFSASRAARHMHCHASANLELAIPGWQPPVQDPTQDNAANRGTHLHEVFAEAMKLSPKNLEKFSEAIAYIAELRAKRRFSVLIEEPMEADWLPSKPMTTADLVLWVKDEIHVVDLKTGKIPVSAHNNEQLMFYAATYGHLAPKALGVYVHIVQPWADVMESWFVDVGRLALFMNEAKQANDAIQAGSTQFQPSDSCMFCPAHPHSRGLKGQPLCPAMLDILYPSYIDEDEILGG